MKQKLSLCSALIHEPDVLVLDEPTTGIDPLSRRQFWSLIDQLKAERPTMTVLVSTAYMEEARRFERIIAMHAGRILIDGTAEQILEAADETTLGERIPQIARSRAQTATPSRFRETASGE